MTNRQLPRTSERDLNELREAMRSAPSKREIAILTIGLVLISASATIVGLAAAWLAAGGK